MVSHQNLEERIREIGFEIYSSIKGDVPSFFDKTRWKGKIMEWSMKDDLFKVQLFRFIDALPVLKTNELVVRLLGEYFTEEVNTPNLIRGGIKAIRGKTIVPLIVASLIKKNVESLARQFIAGKDPEDALKSLETIRRDGFAFTLDLLGEAVLSDKEAGAYAEKYLQILDFLAPTVEKWQENSLLDRDDKGPIPRMDISLKISSFYSQLDPIDWNGSIENTKRGLRAVLRKAEKLGASVTFDMEHYYLKDITIAIFKSILEEEEFRKFRFPGIALQSYLRDSKEDLLGIIEWAKKKERRIAIRLVKGAYWDYETIVNKQKGWPIPVFLDKQETDQGFEEQTGMLLENTEFICPAIASHNIRSISNAIALAEALKLPKEALEFQMLYGMAEPIRRSLRDMNCRVRLYTPLGELLPGMAYLVRRLLENTSNESFLRKSFAENTPFEELIKPPHPQRRPARDDQEKNDFQNEPTTDFSKPDNRERMKKSLEKVKKDFGKRYSLYIGGESVYTEREIPSLNPAKPGEVIGRVCSAGKKEALKTIEVARKAWAQWRNTPPKERAEYLFRAAEELRKRRFELTALEVYEVGKNWKEADADVVEAIDFLEYYGREMIRLGTPSPLSDYPGEENRYLYEPKGVGVVISPWNFPLAIPAGMVSAGIVAGNCVIFKPSELSSVTGWKLSEAFRAAGLPSGVLQFLSGPGEEIGEYLVSHADIDFIAFTGSKEVGLKIVEIASKTHSEQRNVKRVVAEMGGKNAIIVDETADLDEAVKGVLESAIGYQGQKCSACSRVIVIGEIAAEFCERLKEAVKSIKIGPPEDPGNFMGPVIDEDAFKKITYYKEIGEKEGRVLLKREANGEGYFIGPVIFIDVRPDSSIAQEEIFGPVLTVFKAEDIDEAIDIASHTIFALTGGLFSRSPANIEKVKNELRVGNLYINRKITGALVGIQPFGGFGMSGIGSKAGGPDYLIQFLNPRSISENTLRRGFAPSRKFSK